MHSAKEAAEMTGLSTAVLRYYEKEQLLPQIARNDQKYRQYTGENIEWIKMIHCMRRANIPIQDIKEVSDKNFGIGDKMIDKVKAEYMQKHISANRSKADQCNEI